MEFNAEKFLIGFGYLPAEWTPQRGQPELLGSAVAKAQEAYGLDPTGKLDEMTTRIWARTPRCALPDVAHDRGYVSRWGLTHLLWYIENYPVGQRISQADVRGAVKRSMDSISAACGITFEPTTDPFRANVILSTARGTRAGFDGSGGTLAYAYLPTSNDFRGQLRLFWDLDELWTDDRSANGILIENVTCHELCHVMGLDHTNVPGQLMAPIYNRKVWSPQDAWDRPQLVQRYGPTTPPAPTPVPLPTPTPSPSNVIPVNRIELILRLNGDKSFGPYDLDLTKVKTALAA